MSAKKHFNSIPIDINTGRHPLKNITPTSSSSNNVKTKKKTPKTDFVDPLMSLANEDSADYNEQDSIVGIDSGSKEQSSGEENDHWSEFSSTYFNEQVKASAFVRVSIPTPLQFLLSRDTEKSFGNTPETRLAWLEANNDDLSTDKVTNVSSASEFSSFMETCTEQLSKCWKDDQRVQVVKLAIQLASMWASDEDMNDCFDLVFFSTTDVLSFFGKLVYDRLVAKSPGLKVNFSLNDVSLQAKELCKNWLYKIASIRELVPRFYLETALLKCYKFSCDMDSYPALLERLTLMIRGIGNPRAAAFARIYLLRCAYQSLGSSSSQVVRECARLNYEEFIRSCKMSSHPEALESFKLPATWLVQMLFYGLDPESEAKALIIKKCFNELDGVKYPGIILDPLIQNSPSVLLRNDLTWLAHVISVRLDEESAFRFSCTLQAFLKAMQRMAEDQSNLFSRRENVQHVLQQCWMLNLHRVTTADPVDFLQNVKIFLSLWCHQPDLSTKMEEACSTMLSLSINGKKIMTFASLTNHCKERLADILSSIIQYSYQAYQNEKKFGFPFTGSPTSFVPLFECLELSQREKIARKALDELPTIQPDQCDLVEDCHQDLLLRFAQVLSSTVNALTIAGIVILDSIFTHYFQSIIFR